jgi:tetratricopeptide (TPR) repeat protein
LFEKAQALVHMGRHQDALQLYDQVTKIGPYVSGRDLAIARRGRGFVLIEMGDLDNAELAFKESLEIEPDNDIALHELQYIQHLREGGARTYAESVESSGPDLSTCAVCEQAFEHGQVVSVRGIPVMICDRCHARLSKRKRWWQFWK